MARIRKSGPKNARRPFQPATTEIKTGEQIAEALEHIAVALSAIDHNLEILAQHVIKITSPRNGAQTRCGRSMTQQRPPMRKPNRPAKGRWALQDALVASYRTSIDDPNASRRWHRKTCAHCGDAFLSRGITPFYCSPECQQMAGNVRRQGKKHTVCVVCGEALLPQRSSRRYCSGACRQRACRQRAVHSPLLQS